MSKWAPNCTPCTPAWWQDWGCFDAPKCPPCSWTVPPCLPEPTAPMSPYYPFAPYAPPYPQYGFDRCDCGPPPTPWAPYQMPYYETPALYAPACGLFPGAPLAAKKDACCDDCAEGKACSGCAVAPPAVQVGALYVSDAELDALGSQIALMGADVDVAVTTQEGTLPAFEGNLAHAVWQTCKDSQGTWDYKTQTCDFAKPDPTGASIGDSPGSPPHPLAKFRADRWTPFQIKWNGYRGETFHAPTTYDMLRTELSTLVDEWKALGQTTRAVVPPPLAESSGSNAIPWGWIILGGAIVALPFILPAVAGTYLALTRGRGLGL